jgi:hypothetical protein
MVYALSSYYCVSFTHVKKYHAPILALLDSRRRNVVKPFRFENWWLLEEDYDATAKESWAKSANRPFHQKIKYLANDLKKWRRKKPRIDEQLQRVEERILHAQSLHPSLQDYDLQAHLAQQHQQLLEKDEHFHLQRAKKDWAMHGDRNTRFFHQAIIKGTRKDMITYLQNSDGTESTTHEQLAHTLLRYFYDIFAVNASTNQVNADPFSMEDLSQTHQSHIQDNAHSSEVTNHSQLGQDQMIYTHSMNRE